MTEKHFPDWDEDIHIPQGQAACWWLGPLTLYAERNKSEWRLGWRREKDPLYEAHAFGLRDAMPEDETLDRKRWGTEHTGETLRLMPLLADRPVVVAPEDALSVPAGDTLVLYMSSPLWLSITTGSDSKPLTLTELPVTLLSDTWFGENTRVGELCYSIRTRARTVFEEITPLPHRALTRVTVNNRSSKVLDLEQLKVPMNALALHSYTDGSLWTDAVVLNHEDSEQLTSLEIDRKARHQSGRKKQIAAPREVFERQTMMRAFSQLFGQTH